MTVRVFASFALALASLIALLHSIRVTNHRADTLAEKIIEINPSFYKTQNGWTYGGRMLGFGPYYYGDTNVYGGQLDRNGNEQPYPFYQNYKVASGTDEGGAVLTKPMGYDEAFLKDYRSYFSPQDNLELPEDPIEAGYWPYQTADGLLANGEAGVNGKVVRELSDAERKPEPGPQASAWSGDAEDEQYRAERDAYVADEADASFAGDMRFYSDSDWP